MRETSERGRVCVMEERELMGETYGSGSENRKQHGERRERERERGGKNDHISEL